MTSITPAELTLLRSRPHETNLWLSIYKPPVKLACQLNNLSAAPGDRVIIYDNVTTGGWGNVALGMTMYVGTTSGARDVGKIRVRYADATTITVGDNSDIKWADNLYLTVVEFWEIEAVYPRMYTPDPGDLATQIWYKDYDVAYTNQNSMLGSFICMGPHYAGFINKTPGTCDVYYSSSGTCTMRGGFYDYTCYWEFEGAITPNSSSNTPGYISYDTPGHYTTKLTVTNTATGATDVSYRHISIYERPTEGTHTPILNWELESLDGSRDAGGYTARIKVRDNISDIVDGALIVIFADDAYGGIKQSIGGNALNRQSIFFVGYILDGSISYNYEDNSIEFSVGSPSEIMKLTECFPVALDGSTDPEAQDLVDDDIPSAWALLWYMTCGRAMYHYLKWHSTVLFTSDFRQIGFDTFIRAFDASRESVYDAINDLMNGALYGNVVCDRQGKIWAESFIGSINNAVSAFPSVMDVTKQDWIGTPTIEEAYNDKISFMEMGGTWHDPATPDPLDPDHPYSGSDIPYLSQAPGEWPAYRGSVRTIEGLALNNQADLNTLVGNIFAYENSKYAHVGLELSGDYRNIDIAPQEIITLSLEANDNPRRITWNNKAFHPTDMSWSYDPQKGTLLPSLTLHEVTQGFPGTTIVIPPVPPVDIPVVPPVPPFTLPPFIIPTFPTGTATVDCNRWVDAQACYYYDGSVTYDKEEFGWHIPYGGLVFVDAFWKVPVGCSGEICIFPVFLLKEGGYGGTLRCTTGIDKGLCGGNLSYYGYITAGKVVNPSGTDKVVFCPDPFYQMQYMIYEGEVIRLYMHVYTADNDPNPFTEDCWFLGWEIKYGGCP